MELLTPICVIVLIVCVGVMIFCVVNAVRTMKRNKATDEATRKIFMAKIQQAQATSNSENKGTATRQLWAQEPETIISTKPKALNYDEYIDDLEQDEEIASGVSLKDFYKPN